MITIDLQRALWRLGYDPGGCDGVFGPKTQAAIAAFQSANGLEANNPCDAEVLDALSHVAPLILAKHFTPANRPHSHAIDLIVIHTAEAPEIHKEARNVAGYFALEVGAPQASAHYVVDDAEVIQCVLECDIAWHAPGTNDQGIGIEHAGYASQTPEQWDDDYSRAVLTNSAKLVASLCKRFDIPIVKLSVAELAAGGRGICGHVDATNAFNGGRGHVDPGPSFPYEAYLALVRNA